MISAIFRGLVSVFFKTFFHCIRNISESLYLKNYCVISFFSKIIQFFLGVDCGGHVIEARRPDLVLVDKKERTCKIIDFAVPGDSRIQEKEKDKIEKYEKLGRELQKIWSVKLKIIPLVAGSLGAIPKQFSIRLKQIGITLGTAQVHQTVLLGTARILRKVLEM